VSLLNDMTLQRLWSKVEVQSNGCWNLPTSEANIYPLFWFENANWRGNRFILTAFAGVAPPEKPHALHKCNNKACVNPAHLYWGDDKDNRNDLARDNPDSGTFNSQFKPGYDCRRGFKIKPSQVAYAKLLLSHGISADEVAKCYGLHPRYARALREGKSWPNIRPAPFISSFREHLAGGGSLDELKVPH
jgi:hypothetical protein